MKPIRSKKFLLTLMLLTAGCATAFSVSAEDNGYWTMREDSTGLPVMVYTYTEPVEFVISNTGNNDPAPAEPVQAEEDDDQVLVYINAENGMEEEILILLEDETGVLSM